MCFILNLLSDFSAMGWPAAGAAHWLMGDPLHLTGQNTLTQAQREIMSSLFLTDAVLHPEL